MPTMKNKLNQSSKLNIPAAVSFTFSITIVIDKGSIMFKNLLGFGLMITSIVLFAGIAGGIDDLAADLTVPQFLWLCSLFITALSSGLLAVMLIGDTNSDKL